MKKKVVLFLVLAVTVVASCSIALGTDDPLITESYLNDVFMKEVKDYINTQQSSVFSVVSVAKDKTFIGAAGCEIILRQGKAEVIGAKLGGLSDVTGAVDITTGVSMPANHMLIVPRDDGRGFKATTDVVVMVKGDYEIK